MSDEYVVEITEPLNPIKCANLMHPVKQSSENYAGYADAH